MPDADNEEVLMPDEESRGLFPGYVFIPERSSTNTRGRLYRANIGPGYYPVATRVQAQFRMLSC